MMIQIHCAICQKEENVRELYQANFDFANIDEKLFSARRIPDRIHYRIVKCLTCGLIFSTPLLPLKQIFSLYKKSRFNYGKETSFLQKTYGGYLAKILPSKNRKNLRLLEIGCGNGFFLEEARRLGIGEVYGVEPSKNAVAQASAWLKKNIKTDFFRPGLFKDKSFDIICSFHTLDHVIDPVSFIHECYRLLKKGGKIFLVVHNTDAWSTRLLGEKSPIFDIEHVYLFNPSTLLQILKVNGFTKIQVFDIKNTYPLAYWVRMTPLQKLIKQQLLWILKVTRLESIPITIKAGNIGVIAKK